MKREWIFAVVVALFAGLAFADDKAIVDVAEAAVWVAQNQFPALDADVFQGKSPEPIEVEFVNQSPVSDSLPAQLVVRHWKRGCAQGNRQVRDINATLKPLKWIIGDSPDCQIMLVETEDQSYPCPTIELYQRGTMIKTWTGYQSTETLSHELLAAWNSAGPAPVVAQSGSAGAIRGKQQIQDLLLWWRANIGEGVKTTARWDRTGAQTFPLLAKGDWSVGALCGKYGHAELSAKGSRLPIDAIGFGYQVAGDDVTFDIDPLTISVLKLKQPASMQAGPSEFGPGTLLTVITVVRGIYSLLHPTCDLQLGGTVSATGVLNGEMLAIDFESCPSIKLVALFTFQLAVKRLEVKADSVRVLFTGSSLVKERTFAVQ
jgi:hypothetical protein